MERTKIRANSWGANNYQEPQSAPASHNPTSPTLAFATSSSADTTQALTCLSVKTHMTNSVLAASALVLINKLEFGSEAK